MLELLLLRVFPEALSNASGRFFQFQDNSDFPETGAILGIPERMAFQLFRSSFYAVVLPSPVFLPVNSELSSTRNLFPWRTLSTRNLLRWKTLSTRNLSHWKSLYTLSYSTGRLFPLFPRDIDSTLSMLSNCFLINFRKIIADFRQVIADFRQVIVDFRQVIADFRQVIADFRQVIASTSDRKLASLVFRNCCNCWKPEILSTGMPESRSTGILEYRNTGRPEHRKT